jgi:superoxide dismutase, Cu-Zn family
MNIETNSCRLAIHVHNSAITANNCSTTGTHYNPFNDTHGSAFSESRHIGDLGNVYVTNGVAYVKLIGVDVPLYGRYSVYGRSLVLHHNRDHFGLDYETELNGYSDGRMACADIEFL